MTDPKANTIHAVILAGGSGTRLWPLSRSLTPKHLLALDGADTLLQQTAKRLLGQIEAERILTVTHEDHKAETKRQLGTVSPGLAERILAEPRANNTLPAIAWGVAEIIKTDPKAILGIFPADHQIDDTDAFHETLTKAFEAAEQDNLVTLGIKPTGPETGYGYIQADGGCQPGSGRVVSFVEKPSREKAAEYLKSGNYFWNAGIFVFKASRFLEELKKFEPTIHDAVHRIVNAPASRKGSVVRDEYARMKKISIDYGIMEKAARVAVVPATFQWNDLGSWEAMYGQGEKDERRNVIRGNVLALDCSSSLLASYPLPPTPDPSPVLAAIGLKEVAVIQTADAVLVSSRDRLQDVKLVVERLKREKNAVVEAHATFTRPWGSYTVIEEGPGYKIKRIVVDPGQKLSLQCHKQRAEHWVVIEGSAKVTTGSSVILLTSNQSAFIPQGEKHRLENPATTPLAIIEVQTGSYLGEDDIERFDDVYGRR